MHDFDGEMRSPHSSFEACSKTSTTELLIEIIDVVARGVNNSGNRSIGEEQRLDN